MNVNSIYWNYFDDRMRASASVVTIMGGRRSGKTYAIMQYLLTRLVQGDVINVASMTSEQGRLGAYADAKDIIAGDESLRNVCEVLTSPREIRCRGGRMFFNSYQNSETAKGVACDWLFINEANNFTLLQFLDLSANVRKCTFLDWNPVVKFWADDLADPLVTTWKDNPFLTASQHDYFRRLKERAESPTASDEDKRLFAVYYEGRFMEGGGEIFTATNITRVPSVPDGVTLSGWTAFNDPSALVGSDYFAAVLGASGSDGYIYVTDIFSKNAGTREEVAHLLRHWALTHDRLRIYVETNGIIGQDFFYFCQNSGLPVSAWYSRGNKYDRITANYENIISRLRFVESDGLDAYLQQIYDFSKKCEHDDNIDAVSSFFSAIKFGL